MIGKNFEEIRIVLQISPLLLSSTSFPVFKPQRSNIVGFALFLLLTLSVILPTEAQENTQLQESGTGHAKESLQSSTVGTSELASRADNYAMNALFGEAVLAVNVQQVRREAARLPADERFAFLRQWVFPGESHPDLRMSGRFTQTDPSPLAIAMHAETIQAGGDDGMDHRRGGEIVSPVFDLLDVARELGRLRELEQQIDNLPEFNKEHQQRSRAALALLVHLELGDQEAAEKAADKLYRLVEKAMPKHAAEMWPETLVVAFGLRQFGVNPAITDLLDMLYVRRTQQSKPDGAWVWHAHIASLFSQQKRLRSGKKKTSLEDSGELQNWLPLTQSNFSTRGRGFPHATWQWGEDRLRHLPGHHSDFVIFRSPLRGQFAMEGSVGARPSSVQLFSAGQYIGPNGDGDQLWMGDFRGGSLKGGIDPPLSHFDSWIRCRVVVRDDRRTVFVNGQPVHRLQLDPFHAPWIGFRSWSRNLADIRNVQITGRPRIPDSVELSASEELTGWLPYYQETAGSENATWQHIATADGNDEIHGRRREWLEGQFAESLLRYFRPLFEDGSIEYDFFYQPDLVHVHPALDRLAFMLKPDGVGIHWMTDGRCDRTGVPPDNMLEEPQNCRGPEVLPLKPGQWNHMKVATTGSMVTLELNDQIVYEHELEPNNRRTFGLFHYAGETEVRVRNVVMRGEWPGKLPDGSDQVLADQTVTSLDDDLPRLTSVFRHDFVESGMPDKYFEGIKTNNLGEITTHADGLLVTRPGLTTGVRPVSECDLPLSVTSTLRPPSTNSVLKPMEKRLPCSGHNLTTRCRIDVV